MLHNFLDPHEVMCELAFLECGIPAKSLMFVFCSSSVFVHRGLSSALCFCPVYPWGPPLFSLCPPRPHSPAMSWGTRWASSLRGASLRGGSL